MKKQFLNRVQHVYLSKRLPENLVPWKVSKKSSKQIQRTNQTKKAVGLPLTLKKGARGIHQKRLALKFAPSLKINVLERGSLVSTPCSLKVWASNVNRLSCSLKRKKKGTTGRICLRPSLALLREAQSQARRGSAKQPLGIEGLASNKNKSISSFRWKKGASLYSCSQLEGSLSKQQEKRSSPFLLQLLEKKKLRILYGNLSNREINAVIKQAKTSRGGLGDNIFRLLESRLDVVLCKIGFFTTISFARQWVYHGKVQVNSKVLTVANYNLQPGDVISIPPSHCQFLKTQIDTLLDRHVVERAGTPIIDHHNLSKTSSRWTPEGQGATKNRRSLATPFSKAWFEWEKSRSLPFNPLSESLLVVDDSSTRFKGHHFVQPWPARESPPRTPLNLPNIMGFSIIAPNHIRADNQLFDLRVARNVFPGVAWEKLGDYSPTDPASGSSLMINKVDHRLSVDRKEKLRFFSLKLTHVEVSFRLFTAVYLYSPQRILLPATIDIEKIRKS